MKSKCNMYYDCSILRGNEVYLRSKHQGPRTGIEMNNATIGGSVCSTLDIHAGNWPLVTVSVRDH